MNIMSHRLPAPPPEPKYVLRDGMGPVSCVDFGSDDTLYAGTQDGCVHVWDLTVSFSMVSVCQHVYLFLICFHPMTDIFSFFADQS